MGMNEKIMAPTLDEIYEAAERIKPYAHRTPVLTSDSLNKLTGAEIFFKCENFQKIGAFKIRGATNAVFSLGDDEIKNGVATHSSGNHAQALALAARNRGIKAYIVMPRTTPQVKKDAVAGYGGEIVFCEPTLEDRQKTLDEIVSKTGALFIPPFNDCRIIAGQATCALELIQAKGSFDIIMPPVGGGGLLSGTALVTTYLSPETRIFGAEPENANDACRSFQSKQFVPSTNPHTICEGLLSSLGDITFPIILEYVDDIITVSEGNIIKAMRLLWERMKIIVEPSGAVPFGAVLQRKDKFAGKRVGLILSGGNVDLEKLPWL